MSYNICEACGHPWGMINMTVYTCLCARPPAPDPETSDAPMTTDLWSELERELAQAADAFQRIAHSAVPGSDKWHAAHMAAALRARAEKVRLFPRVLSGEVRVSGVVTAQEMFNWLAGPLADTETPADTARTGRPG